MADEKEYIEPKDRHRQLLDDLSHSPINQDQNFDTVATFNFPSAHFKVQSNDWQNRDGNRKQEIVLSQPRKDFVKILTRSFGHLAANPSVPGNRVALHSTYTFPDVVDRSDFDHFGLDDDVLVANESMQTAESFFLETVANAAVGASAEYIRKMMGSAYADPSTDAIHREDRFLMIGERGIGKTIFLNYLLSQHTAKLHEKKVITVRLDLTKEVQKNLLIEEWLQWKICKIIFTYYDDSKINRDALHNVNDPALEHLIEKESADLLFNLKSTNELLFAHARSFDPELTHTEFVTQFRAVATDLRSITSTTPKEIAIKWFFPMMMEFLLKSNGCSLIIILDGLDQLGLTKSDQKRYKTLVKSVKNYLAGEKPLPASFLVTMRPKTFRDQIGDDNFRRNFQYSVVAKSTAKAIYSTRHSYMKNAEFFKGKFRTVEKLGQNYSNSIAGYCNAYIDFATLSLTRSVTPEELQSRAEPHSREIGFAILEAIFGENRRKTFQALSDVSSFFTSVLSKKFEEMLEDTLNIEDFFDSFQPDVSIDIESPYKDLQRYSYLFVEALMLEKPNQSFRREKYTYKIDNEKFKITPILNETNPTRHYLHNIFHHVTSQNLRHKPHVLMGMRSLQLARKLDVFTPKQLISSLCKVFGYEKPIVQMKFQEMLEDGLIKHYTDPSNIVTDNYKMSYAGAYILDRLILSLEYGCLALQTTPVPKILLDQGYFPIRPHTAKEFVVYNKVFASLNFARYLCQVNKREEEEFNQQDLNQFEVPGLSSKDFFGKTEGIMDSYLRSINRIVDHAHENELNNQIRQLDRLIANDGIDRSITES